MKTLALCALQNAYRPQVGHMLLEQDLLGGFARQRVQFINNTHSLSVQVMLDDRAKKQYFYAFYRYHTIKPRNFMWRLMVDDFDMQDYECQFVANSLSINERSAEVYTVSFELRLKPLRHDMSLDETIIDAWETGGGIDFINLLEELVNEDLPNAVGTLR